MRGVRRLHASNNLKNNGMLYLHEVAARDGIQNEKKILDLQVKKDLLEKLISCRPSSVEVASFVREDLVPAMAGAQALCASLAKSEIAIQARANGMRFSGLVPNMRGYRNFVTASEQLPGTRVLDTVVCLVSCTDSHSKANVGMTMEKALETTSEIIRQGKADGFYIQAYASLALGCPFEGAVSHDAVLRVLDKFLDLDVDKLMLADTHGLGEPTNADELLSKVMKLTTPDRVGLHLHNAHGRAFENVQVGIDHGVRHFDAALGGTGGCNYIPNAKGNISTEEVIRTVTKKNISHNLDMKKIAETNTFLSQVLERNLEQ